MKRYFTALSDFYFLNKKIFKSNRFLFICLLAVFIIFDSRALSVDLLNGYDVDEFYFLRIMYSRQYYGFNHLEPQKFFSGFYSYGRLFWIINFIITYIPFAFEKYNAALFITRFLSSVFAVQGLLILKEIISRFGHKKLLLYTVCLLALSMIYFWAVGSWIHPDWIMMFFLLLAFYYYFDIQHDELRAPVNFLMAMAIALALKVQTLQLMPLLFLYTFKEFLLHPTIAGFIASVKKSFVAGIVLAVVFVVLNPYLLHPQGPKLFFDSFTKDLVSNKNNYWSAHIPTLAEKLDAYAGAYLSIGIMLIILVLALIFVYRNIKNLRANYEKFAFIISWVIMATYYMAFVNKTWAHYYLPIAVMALIVFYFTYPATQLKPNFSYALLTIVAVLQTVNLYQHFHVLTAWLYPEKILTTNNSYQLRNDITNFLDKHPDSKHAHLSFTYLLPIPLSSAHLNMNNVYHIPVVDHEQLTKISKLAPYPPDYVIVQKNMYYDGAGKSSRPENDAPVALIDSIKAGKIDHYKLIDSTKELLYIKRMK
jgi:hypothetical protein